MRSITASQRGNASSDTGAASQFGNIPTGVALTTIAAEKAMPLVDLDAEIERVEGRKIREIFAAEGEAAFRRIEKAALKRVAAGRGQVVALGGGALLDPESRSLAESTGRVVFLECPEDELLRRVSRSRDRPLLADDAAARLEELLRGRKSHYASFSERIVPR